jgi:AbrB family looped-hinge helix DNA binding protein
MGDQGQLVIPADLRERAGLAEGTPLVLIETLKGLVLPTRSQLQNLVRADLAGLDLLKGPDAGSAFTAAPDVPPAARLAWFVRSSCCPHDRNRTQIPRARS